MSFPLFLLVTSHLCVALWVSFLCSYLVAYTYYFRNISFILIFLPDFLVSKSLRTLSCASWDLVCLIPVLHSLVSFSFVFSRLNCPWDLTEGYSLSIETCFPKTLQELSCPWSFPYKVYWTFSYLCHFHVNSFQQGVFCFAVLVMIIFRRSSLAVTY